MASKLTTEDIKTHVLAFWESVQRQWNTIYQAALEGNDKDRHNILRLFHYFAGPLSDCVDFEITVGELNRTAFDSAKSVVEMYISPRLLKCNVPVIEALYKTRKSIPNLHVYKYRSYNAKDPLIATIEYDDAKFAYTDFGCQYFSGISEEKTPLVNIAIYVRKDAAEKLLTKKEVTFILPDKTEQKHLKWLPTKTNVIDVLLTNIIGEFNLIHRTGYIEFLPEGDPLIATGSVFTELTDLRGAYAVLDKSMGIKKCVVCDRRSYQGIMAICSRCRKVNYCCRLCQIIDYPGHKTMCGEGN